MLDKFAADRAAVDDPDDKFLVEFGPLFVIEGEVDPSFLAFAQRVYPFDLQAQSAAGDIADPRYATANSRWLHMVDAGQLGRFSVALAKVEADLEDVGTGASHLDLVLPFPELADRGQLDPLAGRTDKGCLAIALDERFSDIFHLS